MGLLVFASVSTGPCLSMLGWPGWPWVGREKKLPEEKNAWAWLTLGSGEKWELRTPPPIDSVSHTEPHFKTHPSVFRSPWELIQKWYWTLLLLVINDKKGDWRQEAQSCSWGRGTVGPSRPMLQSSEDNRESRRGETPPRWIGISMNYLCRNEAGGAQSIMFLFFESISAIGTSLWLFFWLHRES